MKRLCLLIVFVTAFSIKGLGQYVPMLNDSAVWRQGIMGCTDGGLGINCNGGWSYYEFKFSGDTIIGQHTYKIVYNYNELWPYGYLREDSGKVYLKYENENEQPYYFPAIWAPEYFVDTSEFILYDFSLEVGDTFFTRIHKCVEYWNPDTIQRTHYFIVTQTDSIILNNGTSRKRLLLENMQEPWADNYAQTYYSIEWIEGIGSTITFFYNEYNAGYTCGVFDSGVSFLSIACYSVNDTILYGAQNCLLPTEISENTIPKISIYPNPASDILTIDGINNSFSFNIYNTLGSIIKLGNTSKNQIDLSDIIPGIYILSVADKNSTYRVRFMKE